MYDSGYAVLWDWDPRYSLLAWMGLWMFADDLAVVMAQRKQVYEDFVVELGAEVCP